jgi:hypothetical protein
MYLSETYHGCFGSTENTDIQSFLFRRNLALVTAWYHVSCTHKDSKCDNHRAKARNFS